MPEEKDIDLEKDHLIIYLEHDKFHNFEWVPFANFTEDELRTKIFDFNIKQTERNDARNAKLTADQLIREICAYRQKAKPYESLIQEAKEVQESIDKAVSLLDSAKDDLNRIMGLE